MKIVIIHKNTRLLSQLKSLLTAAGHQVTTATTVTKVGPLSTFDCLEPKATRSTHIYCANTDILFCQEYDINVYCNDSSFPTKLVAAMAEERQAVCAIVARHEAPKQPFRSGVTSFVTAKELLQESADNIELLLRRKIKEAQKAITNHDNNPDVTRRRSDRAMQQRLSRERQELLRRDPSRFGGDDIEELRKSFRSCH